MNTNPFQQIAPTPYVSKRKEMPLDTILQTTQALQNKYYENKAFMDKLQVMASQFDLKPNDEYLKEGAINDVRKTLEAIAQNGDAYENATNIVSSLATDLASNQALNKAAQNKKAYNEAQKYVEKLRLQGIDVLDFNDPNFRTENEDGTLNDWTSKYEQALDYGDKQAGIWDKILKAEKDGIQLPNSAALTEDNPFVKIARSSGIKDQQVLNKVFNAFEQYKTSNEYAQQKKRGVSDEDIMRQMSNIGMGRK